jgi:hypothetical protein
MFGIIISILNASCPCLCPVRHKGRSRISAMATNTHCYDAPEIIGTKIILEMTFTPKDEPCDVVLMDGSDLF